MPLPAYAGYTALFLWILLGEAGIPVIVPAELVLFAAGTAAAQGAATLVLVVVLALAADILGGFALYTVVRFARHRSGRLGRLERLIERSAGHAYRFGGSSPARVAAARCVPFLRIPAAVAAALAGLRPPIYAAALAAGSVVWVALFLGGGFAFARAALDL